jgi:hypothetical protein
MRIDSRHLPELEIHWLRLVAFGLMIWYLLPIALAPFEPSIIGTFNLVVHEAGHWIFAIFGQFVGMLGGSLMQIAVPMVFAWSFWRHQQPVGLGFCFLWFGQSMTEVAHYAGDAIAMQLPLLGGEAVTHDWNWLFSRLGILEYTPLISGLFYVVAWTVFILGVMYAIRRSFLPDRIAMPYRVSR